MTSFTFTVNGDNITNPGGGNGPEVRPGEDEIIFSGTTSGAIHAHRSGAGWQSASNSSWRIQSIAVERSLALWGVNTEGLVGKWNEQDHTWKDQGKLGGWTLRSLAFDTDGHMWCVGALYNVGEWRNGAWHNHEHLGGWTLRSLAFDAQGAHGTMWCVGTRRNVGHLRGTVESGQWKDHGFPGGTPLESIAFRNGEMWAVDAHGNVGIVDVDVDNSVIWRPQPAYNAGGWRLRSLAWLAGRSEAYCADMDGDFGSWNTDAHVSRELVHSYPVAIGVEHPILSSAPTGPYTLSVDLPASRKRGTNGNLNVSHPSR